MLVTGNYCELPPVSAVAEARAKAFYGLSKEFGAHLGVRAKAKKNVWKSKRILGNPRKITNPRK